MNRILKKYFYFGIVASLILITASTMTWQKNKKRFEKINEAIQSASAMESEVRTIIHQVQNKKKWMDAYVQTGAGDLEIKIYHTESELKRKLEQLVTTGNEEPLILEQLKGILNQVTRESDSEKKIISERKRKGPPAAIRQTELFKNDGTYYSSEKKLAGLDSLNRATLTNLAFQFQQGIRSGSFLFYGIAVGGFLLLIIFTYFFIHDLSGRKKAEVLLLENNQHLKDFFDSSIDMIHSVDISGKFLYTNKAWQKTLGYNDEDLITLRMFDIIAPEHQETCKDIFKRIFEGENFAGIEVVLLAKNGNRITFEVNATGKLQTDAPHTQVFLRDVTERKKLESALKESEAKLQTIVDNHYAPIFAKDKDGKYFLWNRSCEIMMHWKKEDVIGKTNFDLFPAELSERWQKNEQQVITSGETLQSEETTMTPAGIRTFLTVLFPLKDPSDKTYGLCGINFDITEKKEAENKIRQLAQFTEHVYDAIVSTDENFIIKTWNKSAGLIYGYTEEEAIGQHAPVFTGTSFPSDTFEHMMEEIHLNGYWKGEVNQVGKNGETIYTLSTVSAIKNERNEITGFVKVHHDMTAFKKAEMKIIEMNKNLQQKVNEATSELQQVNKSLSEMNQRFELITHATNDGLWDWNIKKNETWWNDDFYKMHGYVPETTKPDIDAWIAKIHPDDREYVLNNFQKAMDSNRLSWSDEFRFQMPDGSYGHVYDRGYIIRDSAGKPVRMFGSLVDITQRKKAEEKFSKTFHASPIPIIITELETGKFIDINRAFLELFGFTKEEVIGHTTSELHVWEETEDRNKLVEQLKKHGSVINRDIRYCNKQGEERDALCSIEVIELEGKKCMLSIFHDITERKQTLEMLSESESRYRLLIENMNDGLMRVDNHAVIEYVNKRFCEMVGYTAEELIGKNSVALLLNREGEKILNEQLELRRNGISSQYEIPLKKKSGDTIWLLVNGAPVFDSRGEIIGTMGINNDITERKKAEEELKLSRDQLRKLSTHLQVVREEERTAISREIHDVLGQRLTALHLDLSWLNKKLQPAKKTESERITAMKGIVDELLDSVQNISLHLRPQVLDDIGLPEAIEWQAGEFERRTQIKCDLQLEMNEEILCNEIKTTAFRILQESLTNISRHAQASVVKISLRKQNEILILEIQDNGKGISPNEITDKRSIGLLGMTERAKILKGEFTISGNPGTGTFTRLTIPIEPAS
ncbi:MAG: PAS domain S-box protein [Bacteroidetes bacterium]|nr:PAS domain S-box protein [Bacteroidota bacterium]